MSRQRGPNFSTEEKLSLLNIISQYKHIIECKKTDTISWKDKEVAWNSITKRFNAISPYFVQRSKESLRKFYENRKKDTRKIVANRRVEILKTDGDGPPPLVEIIDQTDDELLLNIMNQKTVSDLENSNDGHNIVNSNLQSPADNINEDDEAGAKSSTQQTGNLLSRPSTSTSSNNQLDNESSTISKIHQFQTNNGIVLPSSSNSSELDNKKSTHLKTQTSTKLLSKKNKWLQRRRLTLARNSSYFRKKYKDLAAIKLELATLQKDAFITETKIKQQREEIEFQLRKKSLELDIEIKNVQLKKLLQ